MADHYSGGVQIDPVAEAELRRYYFTAPEPDYAFEDLAEFGARREEKCERDYTLMEIERDPSELLHDRYVTHERERIW